MPLWKARLYSLRAQWSAKLFSILSDKFQKKQFWKCSVKDMTLDGPHRGLVQTAPVWCKIPDSRWGQGGAGKLWHSRGSRTWTVTRSPDGMGIRRGFQLRTKGSRLRPLWNFCHSALRDYWKLHGVKPKNKKFLKNTIFKCSGNRLRGKEAE